MSKEKDEKQKRQADILSQKLINLSGEPIKLNEDEATLLDMCKHVCGLTDPEAKAEDILKIYEVAKKLTSGDVLSADDIVLLKKVFGRFVKNPLILGACNDKLEML